jgi:hypothetical protein
MIIGGKNADLKRRTETSLFDRNLATSLKQGEEVAHFAWFGEPWYIFSMLLILVRQEREKSSRPDFTMCGEP